MTIGSPSRSIGIRYIPNPSDPNTTLDAVLPVAITNQALVATNYTAVERLREMAASEQAVNHVHWLTDEAADLDRDGTPGTSESPPLDTMASKFSESLLSKESSPDASGSSSGQQSPTRGRTTEVVGTNHGLVSWATTRRRAGPSSIELDTSLMQDRWSNRDLSVEPSEIEIHDSIIEPFSVERVRLSVSEVLNHAGRRESPFGATGFADSQEPFAILGLRLLPPRKAPSLPLTFFQQLLSYIDFETYLSVRLSCHCWSAAVTSVRPLKYPSVYHLPAEIVEQIYNHLSPADFNAARHTCRSWMRVSLDYRLLSLMLKRGGCWAAARTDLALCRPSGTQQGHVNEEWLASKRLAIECSFGPDWTGNGTRKQASWTITSYSDGLSSADHEHRTSLRLTSQTNFEDLRHGYGTTENPNQNNPLSFTTSVCGKFLLATHNFVIYVYRLHDGSSTPAYGGHIHPFTSVVCPAKVLSVSMDTSSQRFAIGGLLEGRMGLVCNLHDTSRPTQTSSSARQGATSQSFGPHADHSLSDNRLDHTINGSRPRSWSQDGSGSDTLHHVRGTFDLPIGPSTETPLPPRDVSVHIQPLDKAIPVETGPRSIYRNLCSPDDPPLSVAICPQRQCVAFGCSTGIELHWVDALTGQDLNRWFPLAARSDFLYFLPPRVGVDSARKLRLISSAGLLGSMRAAPTIAREGGLRSGEVSVPGRAATVDHYRAVPLSDGWNVLFTEPGSGRLFLGGDAPMGAENKLVRRIELVGPLDENGERVVPSVYAGGADLRWGVRVVVGYGERLWLFCVPPDMFEDGREKKSWAWWYSDGGWGHRLKVGEVRPVWPVRIRGTEIGRVEGLVSVAVDAGMGMVSIWACASGGTVFVWQVCGGWEENKKALVRRVMRDGSVLVERDADGDVVMRDAPPLPPPMPKLAEQSTWLLRRGTGLDGAGMDVFRFGRGEDEFEDEGYVSDGPEEVDDWEMDYLGHGLGVDEEVEMGQPDGQDCEILCG